MSSNQPGVTTLPNKATERCQVTGIERLGFWILVDDTEYFVPFEDYPVFRHATIDQIYAVQSSAPNQLYWPELDADIELEALISPENYPLVFSN